jgi:hypothetical protein
MARICKASHPVLLNKRVVLSPPAAKVQSDQRSAR